MYQLIFSLKFLLDMSINFMWKNLLQIVALFLYFCIHCFFHNCEISSNSIKEESVKKPILEKNLADDLWKNLQLPEDTKDDKDYDYKQISLENRKDQRRVYRVLFTQDNKFLLVVTSFRISLYKIPELSEISFLEPRQIVPGGFTGVSLSNDGKEILAGASWENMAYLLDWSGNKLKSYSCKHPHSYPEDVKFSSDQKLVYISCLQFAKDKRYLGVYKVSGEEVTFSEVKHSYLEIVNNQTYSFSAKEILMSDVVTGKKILIRFPNNIQSYTFFNEKEWVTGSEGQWTFWSLVGSNLIKKSSFTAIESGFKGEDYNLDTDYRTYAALSPSGKYFLTGGKKGAYIWNRNGEMVRRFPGHVRNVSAVAFSPDGMFLVSASPEKIILWGKNQEANLE